MEFPVGEALTASSSSSVSSPSLWSQIQSRPLPAAHTNGENGFLAAGFPPPVIHAFSIRTRLGTRLRVCRERFVDCFARRRGLLAAERRSLRVYGTQAEMYASATAPSREREDAAAASSGDGGGGGVVVSSSSSDSPPYMPVAQSPQQQQRPIVFHHQPQQHRETPTQARHNYRDLAV